MNNKTKAIITPVVLPDFKPGAILKDHYGYEQTNIDFYCIVERKGLWVTLLLMKKNVSQEIGFMTNQETPLEIDYTAAPVRKKIKVHNSKEVGFTFRNYAGGGWCNIWNGKPAVSTHYA